MKLNIDLSSLAAILWCGMVIIAGSIWVLASQVRKVADLLEQHARTDLATRQGSARAHTSATSRVRTVSRPIEAAAGRRFSRSEANGSAVRG